MRGTWQSASADGGRGLRYPVVMETDRDRVNASPALPLDKVESEADHFFVCEGCGQAVDMRRLGEATSRSEAMTTVRLEHPEQRPIVLHEHEAGYSITIGNIPDEDAKAAQLWLAAKAVVAFGAVEVSNIQAGTIAGRSEVYVIVDAPLAEVNRFLNEVLKITPNQIH